MPLHRIRASSVGTAETLQSRLRSHGIHLASGHTLLNRLTGGATALIVMRGHLKIGVSDDDALLAPGEGVLLPAGTVYSLKAESDSVAVLFELPAGGGRAEPAEEG